jgi:hypothetical protein
MDRVFNLDLTANWKARHMCVATTSKASEAHDAIEIEDRNQRSMTFHQVRIVVGNQAPSASLFDPYPSEAILLGYDFFCVLALHRRESCLHRRVAVHADSNLVSRDRLELQAPRCEVGEDIFFRSDGSARADPDEVISVDSVERHRIRMDLRLNAVSIRFSDLLDNASRALVPRLRMSRNGSDKQEASNHEISCHGHSFQDASSEREKAGELLHIDIKRPTSLR